MAGSSQIRLTVAADPCTLISVSLTVTRKYKTPISMTAHTLNTPGGIPALAQSSAMIMVAPGSRSEGLTMSVLPVHQYLVRCSQSARAFSLIYVPVTVAKAADHNTIMAGKLNGVMAAVTPKGRRRE